MTSLWKWFITENRKETKKSPFYLQKEPNLLNTGTVHHREKSGFEEGRHERAHVQIQPEHKKIQNPK